MKRQIVHFGVICLGVGIIGVAINMFLAPHHIAAGGVSGIGILVESFFGIDRSIIVLILNVVMLVLAAIFLGKEALIKILFGSMLLPLALAVIPEVSAVDDTLLAVLFGSGIFAVGVALLYHIGASSGGTTVPPLIFKKYFGLNTSIGLVVTDLGIVIFNIFVFSVMSFFYAILSMIVTAVVMSYIETGLNRKKSLLIMSESHMEEITATLLDSVDRGATLLNAEGAYTGNESQVLLTVVTNQEYRKAIQLVKKIDPKAFIISYNVTDVHGIGFTYQNI